MADARITVELAWRDAHWLAAVKPPGIPTTAPPSAGVVSLVDRVRATHAARCAYVHPLSRLDVEVSGVVLFALTSRAVAAARRAREAGAYKRRYVALLAGAPAPPRGAWAWPVGVDPRDAKRRVADGGRDAQEARTMYTTWAVAGETAAAATAGVAWVALDLETGRTHQIRVHARRAGCPVLGDRAYDGPRHVVLADGAVVAARRVMLHALWVVVPETTRRVQVAPPEDFAAVWRGCGGAPVVEPAGPAGAP